jgi:hypothetical protein
MGRRARVGWAETQRSAHDRNWPDVDSLLRDLPPHLFRQVKLLEYDLAIRYAASGQFRDIFVGTGQVPLLSISTWLFDDLRVSRSPERDRAEGHLFRAALLLAGRIHIFESLQDRDSFYDTDHVSLIQHFSELAALELARTVPGQSPFWTQWAAISTDDLERGLELRAQQAVLGSAEEPGAFLRGRWSAVARLTAHAASAFADREELGPRLAAMMDDLTAAVQIRDELATLMGDVERGRPTYPIRVIAQAAGIRLYPWPDVTEVLGAMLVTGSLRTIREEALARVRLSCERSRELGLPTFTAYLEDATGGFETMVPGLVGGLGVPRAASVLQAPPGIAERRLVPTLEEGLAMAEGFLLSDLSFKESWESHREGMFGSDLVASRYPAGLVMEMLATHGHQLAEQIDDFLAFTVANGFRYFDHQWSGIDSDTLGVYLRLLAHAAKSHDATAVAKRVLECLKRNVLERGVVPVWIRGCQDAADDRPPVLDLGEGCGTVAAHLLLGLSTLETADYREVLEVGALDLLKRIRDRRLRANVNYPPLYALGTFFRLIGVLANVSAGPDVAKGIDATRAALLEELQRAAQARVLTAQHAALLLGACLSAERPDLIDPAWSFLVLRQQRFDGSWRGEPFFAAPNRGRSVTWYESSILTSAMCYDALVRSSRGEH